MSTFRTTGLLAALALSTAGMATAESLGEQEYMNACASCHGASGAGDGPLADLMTVPVPPVTNLSAANEGVFPMLDVIQTIDGRQGTRGHGYPMPVWGRQFEMQADADGLGRYGGEVAVRGRVLSIAYYLESIQE